MAYVVSTYNPDPYIFENVRLRNTPDYYSTHNASVDVSCDFSINWTGTASVAIQFSHAPLFDDGNTQTTSATSMAVVKDKKYPISKTLSVPFDPTDENSIYLYWRIAVTRQGASTPEVSPALAAIIKPDPLFTVTPSSGSIVTIMPFSVEVTYSYYACTGPMDSIRVYVLDGSSYVFDRTVSSSSLQIDVKDWLPKEKAYNLRVGVTTTNGCTNTLTIPVTFRWALPAPPEVEIVPDDAACALDVIVAHGDSIVTSPQSTFPGGEITGDFRGIEFDGSYTATMDDPAGPAELVFPQLSELTITYDNIEETEIFGFPYPTVGALPSGPVDTFGIAQDGTATVTHRINSVIINPAQVDENGFLLSSNGNGYVIAQYQSQWQDSWLGKPDVSCRELALCNAAKREIWTARDVSVWEIRRQPMFACSMVGDVFTVRFLLPWVTDDDIEDSSARAAYISDWFGSHPTVWFPCVEYESAAGDFSDLFGSLPSGVDITISTVADLTPGGVRLFYDACETMSVDLGRRYRLPDGSWSSWEQLSANVRDGSTVIDNLAPFNVPVEYRAVSHSNVGGVNETVIQTVFERNTVAINYGDGFAQHVEMEYNPSSSYSWSDDSENVLFAGHSKPTHFAGTALPVSRTATCMIVGVDAVQEFERVVANRHSVMMWRDPFGELVKVSTSWKASAAPGVPLAKTYSVSAEEVE